MVDFFHRVDKMEAALRSKIETMNGFSVDRPDYLLSRLFREADLDKSGKLCEQEFVNLMIKKLNFVGYEEDVKALFKRYDLDHSHTISLQ
jgi:Ca2+-binding EF-hand superfamily protein